MKRRFSFAVRMILLSVVALSAREIDFSPLAAQPDPDSLHQVQAWTSAPSDSAAAPGSAAPLLTDAPEKPQFVIRNFNHKEQVITGSIIMSCLALMMVTMNNYNPR